MYQGLSLDQAPPLSVPLRFFLTAPVMALLAGGILIFAPAGLLVTRWSPEWLAVTHLFALGFVAMVMMGAVFQMLPVVIGAPVSHPVLFGGLIHLLMTLGTLALAGGLLFSHGLLLSGGGLLLLLAVASFVTLALECFIRSQSAYETAVAMRWAVISLAFTALFGIILVGGHQGWWPLWRPSITRLHIGWGLGGWIFLLILGVSYQVIPMFYVSNPYPKWLKRFMGTLVFALLILQSILTWLEIQSGVNRAIVNQLLLMVGSLLGIGCVVYALVTFKIIGSRKRKVPDPTLWFWYTFLVFLILAGFLLAMFFLVPGFIEGHPQLELTFGVVVLFGGVASVIQAMVFKIVPFLVWFHLQSTTMAHPKLMGTKIPHMKQIISDQVVRRHYWLHLASLLALLGAPWVHESLFQLAGGGVFLQCLHLLYWVGESYRLEGKTRSQWEIDGLLRKA